jgi:hypothetical protein
MVRKISAFMCESLFVLVVEVKQREEKRKEEKGK